MASVISSPRVFPFVTGPLSLSDCWGRFLDLPGCSVRWFEAALRPAWRGFALSKSLPLSYTFLVLVGASMMAVFATVNSLVQLITTNEMRGRVMSVYNFAFRGGMPMGNLLSGWLVPLFTAPIVLGVNGFLLILLALYFLFVQRQLAER